MLAPVWVRAVVLVIESPQWLNKLARVALKEEFQETIPNFIGFGNMATSDRMTGKHRKPEAESKKIIGPNPGVSTLLKSFLTGVFVYVIFSVSSRSFAVM